MRTQLPLRAADVVALAIASALALGLPFLVPSFLLFQISLTLTYAIAILGINLLLGFAGQVSLAQGAFFACGAYTFAILAGRHGVSYELALVVAAMLTAAVGAAVGLPALRLPGLQLAIVTFGLAALVPQLILKFDRFTGGFSGIRFPRPGAPHWFPGDLEVFGYAVCLVALAACVLVMRRALHGDAGRSLRALRDGPLVAESLGINLTRVRLAAFAISAAFAGLGGGLFAMLHGSVNPSSFEALKSIEFLIGAIVGGVTSISGALIGAVFVVFLPEWTADIDIALSGVLYAVCLLLTMLFARHGLAGLASSWCRRALRAARIY